MTIPWSSGAHPHRTAAMPVRDFPVLVLCRSLRPSDAFLCPCPVEVLWGKQVEVQCCCHHRYALECRPLSFQLAHVSVFRFCFNCLKDPHSPVPCKMVNEWMEKCEGEGETFKYISANTKDCPKCGSPVEKNGGCNLMTCRCGTFFCWVRVFTSSPVFACSCHDELSRV